MELDEVIKARRSVRKYRNTDISDSVIVELLDLATHAPSSLNGQPWHFIVIRNDDTKRKIAEIKNKYCPPEKQNYKSDFLENAPVIIVVSVDIGKSFNREIENATFATANIILGAKSRNIGSVFMTAYTPGEPRITGEIKEVLNIPNGIKPITIIPLGYPDETPEPKEIRDLEEILHHEKF